MSLWHCPKHGATGPMACCPKSRRVSDTGTPINATLTVTAPTPLDEARDPLTIDGTELRRVLDCCPFSEELKPFLAKLAPGISQPCLLAFRDWIAAQAKAERDREWREAAEGMRKVEQTRTSASRYHNAALAALTSRMGSNK